MGKVLYLECNMGAAGDMLAAALYELLGEEDQREFCRMMSNEEMGIEVVPKCMEKCGVRGTHMTVRVDGAEECGHAHAHHEHTHGEVGEHEHEHHEHTHGGMGEHEHEHHGHHHASLADVHAMIEKYPVGISVQAAAKQIYERIAAAESHAHGKPVTEIHFHEVGMKDAVADIVNTCWIMDRLAVDQVIVSEINVGYGEVHCAHGILPVPAPATAFLLQGAPVYQGEIRGELCTPTGVALLQHFRTSYGRMPAMQVEKVGYGMGKKDFAQANCIRAFLGKESGLRSDQVVELSCNLDDMTGEEIAFACEMLRDHGALDVYTESISMKKNRPGIKLVCMCRPDDADALAQLLLKHTTTWGVRKIGYERYVLDRRMEHVQTRYGDVRLKRGQGYGVSKQKPEYEDLAAIAQREQISLREIESEMRCSYWKKKI